MTIDSVLNFKSHCYYHPWQNKNLGTHKTRKAIYSAGDGNANNIFTKISALPYYGKYKLIHHPKSSTEQGRIWIVFILWMQNRITKPLGDLLYQKLQTVNDCVSLQLTTLTIKAKQSSSLRRYTVIYKHRKNFMLYCKQYAILNIKASQSS